MRVTYDMRADMRLDHGPRRPSDSQVIKEFRPAPAPSSAGYRGPGCTPRTVDAVRCCRPLQVGLVGHGLDPFLRRDDVVVAGHHDDGAELKALRQVHGAMEA